MLEYIRDQQAQIKNILIIRHDRLVADIPFYPYQQGMLHETYSCTKSILSALIGIAIDKGLIEHVNQPVADFFSPEEASRLNAEKQRLTLEQLLTMRGGFCHHGQEAELRAMMASDDWFEHLLQMPMAASPGSQFSYCDADAYWLSVILQKASGMNALTFARRYLFAPLNIKNVEWPTSPEGFSNGFTGIRMTPHDLAKIGLLYLHDGKWKERQIVSAEWIQASTQPHVPRTAASYGYLWWVVPEHGYVMMVGSYGQYCFVIPKANMVVVFTSALKEQPGFPRELLEKFILPAARSDTPLPETMNAGIRFNAIVKALGAPASSIEQPRFPAVEARISANTYIFDENPFALQEASFHFEPDAHEALFEGEFEIPCASVWRCLFGDTSTASIKGEIGLDGDWRFTRNKNVVRAARGAWQDESVFKIEYQSIDSLAEWTIFLRFDENVVLAELHERLSGASVTFTGRAKE